MKRILAIAAILLPSAAFGQQLGAPISDPPAILPETGAVELAPATATGSGFLTGNRNYRNFIGFMSNPVQSIEPRAVTQIWPVFQDVRISTGPVLPDGAAQVYGAGVNLALSDRLSLGLNQGGFASTSFRRDRSFTLRDAALRLSPEDRKLALDLLKAKIEQNPAAAKEKLEALKNKLDQLPDSQDRQGWLNIGGFVQYMVYENVEGQSFATAGLRWMVPCGSQDLYQGRGPAYLAPYVTVGKEFGKYHILATTGYEFAAERTSSGSESIYANVHLDRQTFGWLYPLVEINVTHYTMNTDIGIATQRGFVDLGTFQTTGNIATMAAGANVVLIRDKLELGAVYAFPVFTERQLNFDGLLVKAVYRY